MMKTLKRIIQEGKEKYRIPRHVRDLIPIDAIWKDGIFKAKKSFLSHGESAQVWSRSVTSVPLKL